MNDLDTILKPVRNFFAQHHPVIVVASSLLALCFVIYTLYQIVNLTEVDSESAVSTISKFDKKTVDKIKTLRASSDTKVELEFPTGRSNPFVE